MQFNRVNNIECLHSLVVSHVDRYVHVSEFHMLVDCGVAHRRGFLWPFLQFIALVWQLITQAVLHPPSFPPLLCGGSWLGCQDLPALGTAFIKELAANSGSPWMSLAPNLYFSDAVVNLKQNGVVIKKIKILQAHTGVSITLVISSH